MRTIEKCKAAIVACLIMFCAGAIYGQGTSQIDTIQFQNSGGEKIKTYAGPFKFRCGSGLTCTPLSGNVMQVTAGSGGGLFGDLTAQSPLAVDHTRQVIGGAAAFSITQAGVKSDGYLSSTDWATFNGKQNALGFTPENVANKGAASGYAPLSASQKVPDLYLPAYRQVLLSDKNYYVRTDGMDENDGSANDPAHAFLTIQHAVEVARDKLDCNFNSVEIFVADGTYSDESIRITDLLDCFLFRITGNLEHPDHVILGDVEDDYCFFVDASHTPVTLQGFKLINSAGYGISVRNSSTPVQLYAIEYGDTSLAHIHAYEHGSVAIDGGYSITGSAPEHMLAEKFGSITVADNSNVVISYTPAFSTAFAHARDQGQILLSNLIYWSGSATGKRFIAERDGHIVTGGQGLTWFPGSIAGQVLQDGSYDDTMALVASNAAISGATKTKITYDAKGLVTSGADATTADIADSTDKRYVTDAQLTVIGNTSGTNSGNETTTTIGTLINGATAKTTPADADMLGLMDSQASNVLKKLSWSNTKAGLKTYFDGIYLSTANTRPLLTADKTYYVRTDGSDSNDGSADDAAHAFLTIQAAYNHIKDNVDLRGFNAIIKIADGTYTGWTVCRAYVSSGGIIIIRGNTTTPDNVYIHTVGDSFTAIENRHCPVQIESLKISSDTGSCLMAEYFGCIYYSDITFSTAALGHIVAYYNSYLEAKGNYRVSGNAGYHIISGDQAMVFVASRTITYSNNPVFANQNFLSTTLGYIQCAAMIFTNGNTVTGCRYNSSGNSVIQTGGGGPDYIPGSSAGATATGGQYL